MQFPRNETPENTALQAIVLQAKARPALKLGIAALKEELLAYCMAYKNSITHISTTKLA